MSESGARILVIDDESQIRKLLRITLTANGFAVTESDSGEKGILQISTDRPDLVVLDLGLPDMEGLEVLARIREWSKIPVIVLTARDREQDKIVALNSGADDYVTKPFSMGELMARIRVALRHGTGDTEEPILSIGPLVMDMPRRVVEMHGEKVKLTPTEYDLLKVLVTHAGRVLTHRMLFEKVWGGKFYDTDSQHVRVHIGHLRKKIEADATRPKFIITEPGIGYRFQDICE